ncbi:unnamed protein product [Larinioides sclopetarius]|uniref:PH domain-containing protein n=1 Tax=Larinioides sclopetarius TaxID=280406 RepID=A0AAV2A3P3_9ARAC
MAPMRRKSQGSIRSPHVKRDSQSQVIMEGWLYKLEGGALKQFKHRWCVLADFCLFFYKGPSEEKVTSSILLPSYKISPCTTEDKISRKFSFKAEHQNMKTYYFAAEDKDSMKRWMNAMSLASIMQNFVRSENFETTFSSASNDDEDSGFTSYRSRRYTSQKLSTTYDSNFSTEPLKQRSNSYGDRMGEVYLGSDDKYPNVYNSTASHMYKNSASNQVEPPRRQPLYANAPPKPRRLTQSDSYGFYSKDCYDPRDQEVAAIQASQYAYEKHEDSMYLEHQKDIGYHALEQNPSYMPGSDPALMHAGMQYVDNYPPNMGMDAVPDLYKNQPPRPRSADFLERDADCGAMPDVAMYSQSRQPQRPKSSLEYYDRYGDSEDCNFDYYREAVRIQADNLYANKNLNKPRKHHRVKQTENVAYNDPQNIHYTDNNYIFNDQVSPCYASGSKACGSNVYSESSDISSRYFQNEHYDSRSRHSKPKKNKEESLQRLFEWKQRMLQSPLTKRNHLQSNSSDNSSPMASPQKSYKTEYQKKIRKELQTHEAYFRSSSKPDDYAYTPASSQEDSPQRIGDQRRRNESSGSLKDNRRDISSPSPKFSNIEHPKYSPQLPDPSINSNLSVSAENLYKQNIMYCVDSENNEILFSYDDSPTGNTPKSFQTCHYPPQMHSFTTMPNVSSIGSDSHDAKKYEVGDSQEQSHWKEISSLPRKTQDKVPVNIVSAHHRTTYSSDDEASLDSDNKHQIKIAKVRSTEIPRSSSAEIHVKEPNQLRKLVQQSEGLMCKGKRLSVSAGDLLGKTHEELVLLLIQLRRNQTKILRAKEKLEKQIESLQEFPQSNSGKQPAYQNKKELQRQILLLQKQYEDTQPLVTLVDNMVKLGSLYGSSNRRSFSLPLLDTSQEDVSSPVNGPQSPDYAGESNILSKLLAEESNFQKRISEIYSLDKGLRNETNSISSLHQDKEMLEYTLSGMRNKILDHQDRPSELQKLKKQQKMIEKELVRVKRLLSTSAKKIEDAASKNDQMEKDILHLRQILKEALKTGSSEAKDSQHNRADIEAELSRVQNVLDELANHRHEINNTVMKLKGEAPPTSSMGSEYKASPSGTAAKETHLLKVRREPESSTSPVTVTEEKETTHLKKVKKGVEVRASPTGVAGSAPLPVRKKQHSMYLETDLDTMETRDLATVHEKDLDDIPVYVNAEEINNPNEEIYENFSTIDYANMAAYSSQSDGSATEQCAMQDINEADERMKRFYGIIPKEKPSEIKTVRIVKRQSERRNREKDKKRVTYDDQSSVWVVEEPDISSDDLLDVDEGMNSRIPPTVTRPSSIHLLTSTLNRQSNAQSAHERLFGTAAPRPEKPTSTGSHDRSYTTKRSKRRHYTVSGYQYALDPQFSQYFKDQPRSRDDVDMERCLRTANTPDIVRSTIKKNDVFDDKIIERELMLPQKIEIPERYVEIEPEQLSASERLRRSIKAENICKMLSETTTTYEDVEERSKSPEALHKKLSEEKKKRAHLLNLNRAIAREVVEKSKAVAANVCSSENQTST